MALTLTITDAGRAALINAQNIGTNAVVIDRIGISSSHVTGDLKALTALPNERKRLNTFGGDVVADDVLHVTLTDSSDDTYSLYAFGVYFSTGVLFAVCTSPDRIMEKSASAMLLQSVDITLTSLDTSQIEFGPAGFTNPPATTERMGVVELATYTETATGTDASRAVTPFSLRRLLEQWADALASKIHGHTVADISGLGDALANKAEKGHRHNASDVTSGVFEQERLPKLPISWVTNLADSLASKALKDHQHTADDIASGVLAMGRIPALAMEKITGLAVALSIKADAAVALLMRGSLGSVNTPNNTLVPGAYRQATNANAQIADGYPVANDGGTLLVYNPSTDTGLQTYHGRSSGRFWSRPFLAGSFSPWVEHWTSGNLKPAATDAANQFGQPQLITNAAGGSSQHADGKLLTLSNFAPGILFEDRSAGMRNALISVDSSFLNVWTDVDGSGNYATLITRISLVNPTAPQGDSTTRLATTEFVATAIAAIPLAPNATTSVRGLALLATNAQTLAGTDASRSMTPAGLWSFAKSIGPSGYIQIPGTDLIIQWGVNTASMTEGLQHATLPVAFGGGCLVALANPRNPSAVVQYDWYIQVNSKWLDRITFYANKANDSSPAMQGFEWIAIGLAKGNPNPAYSTGGGGGTIPPGGGGGGGDYTPEV